MMPFSTPHSEVDFPIDFIVFSSMTSTVELRAAIPASQEEALATATELAAAFRGRAARRDCRAHPARR
jgi:hypothetical protein